CSGYDARTSPDPRFPLRPDPVPRETVPSFFSRFAAMRRTPVVEFAQNMGFSFRRLLDGDSEALDSLAHWAGLASAGIEVLPSWSGEPIGDARMRFRGEVFISRALRNPTLRGCPVCLREDALAHSGVPAEAMAMGGDWQLREVTLCVKHRHLLVPLWTADNRYTRYDFALRSKEIEADLLAGTMDRPACDPTEYDLWLDRRLEGGEDHTWLANQGLYPATAFCRLLGMEFLRHQADPGQDDIHRLRAVQQAGFAVARQGEAAISAAFIALVEASGGKREEPKAVFGHLHTKLRTDYANDPAFDLFRQLLRDCILSVWPVAAGEIVLGEVQPERRLHSLYSAAREVGVTEELLEPFLIVAGALIAGDTRYSNRRVFNAKDHAALLAEIPTLVSLKTLQREMGASRTELARLVSEGLLTPRVQNEAVHLRWSLTQAMGLLADLKAKAQQISATDAGWEPLLAASRRCRQPIAALLDAVRNGRLVIGAVGDGFSDLRLRILELDRLARPSAVPDAETLITATAFGISVGIKDKGRFRALIDAGQASATVMRNPKTGIANTVMTAADIADFHRRFVTMRTLSAETGRAIPELRADLMRAGVPVFSPEGQDFGRLFLREAVEAALGATKDRKL
ncbi:MAG: TniQ family protein, partial [Gemmobacter sp.]|nr:TniQ family protein [Gemmobacter sp.]